MRCTPPKKTHVYCFEPIEEAIFDDLFGPVWLDDMTHNELALTLVRTLEDFMTDLEAFLDEVMVQKTVEAQISSSVNFYIKCLLAKSSRHTGRNSMFSDNEKALSRMRGDISIIREYFEGLHETMPTLGRIIEQEFDLMEAVLELISIAAGISKSDAQDFILLLQKRIRNFEITKLAVGDLYHMVKPGDEYSIYELIDGMEDQMNALAPTDDKALALANDRNIVPGLRIDHILAQHCSASERKRPLKAGALDAAEKTLKSWRISLTGSATKATEPKQSASATAKNLQTVQDEEEEE